MIPECSRCGAESDLVEVIRLGGVPHDDEPQGVEFEYEEPVEWIWCCECWQEYGSVSR